MTYERINFVNQSVERPRTYEMTHNADGSITLVDSFGLVDELGTPINADTMNHIEEGIASNEARITILEDIPALRNMATADSSISIGNTNSGVEYAVTIGKDTSLTTSGAQSVSIGYASGVNANYGIAIGRSAKSQASQAIQLGLGTNNNAKTLQIFDYTLLDENGKIPVERYSIQFMPDYENGIDITSVLKASPYTYTPPTDGFIKFYTGSGEKVWNIGLIENYSAGDINNIYYANMGEGIHVTDYLPVFANQTIYAKSGKSGTTAIFYPLKGIN